MVVGFPDAQPDGSVAEALAELVANGTIRLLDMVIAYKDGSGETTLAEVTDIDGDGIPDLIAMRIDTPGLLTDADAAAAVEALPRGSAVRPHRLGKHMGYPGVDGIAGKGRRSARIPSHPRHRD